MWRPLVVKDVQLPVPGDGLADVEDGGDHVGLEPGHQQCKDDLHTLRPTPTCLCAPPATTRWCSACGPIRGEYLQVSTNHSSPDAVGGGVLQPHP